VIDRLVLCPTHRLVCPSQGYRGAHRCVLMLAFAFSRVLVSEGRGVFTIPFVFTLFLFASLSGPRHRLASARGAVGAVAVMLLFLRRFLPCGASGRSPVLLGGSLLAVLPLSDRRWCSPLCLDILFKDALGKGGVGSTALMVCLVL
jgi:hypothetical protein